MEERKWVLLLHLFFLLVKFQSVVTSSYQADQQEKDRVIDLPGLPNNLSFAQYSGHVTVNEVSGRALFYWFFEAVEEPSSKPIVIWLQGGPGCSSVGLGLAAELGPFHIHADGKTLYMNPYSWNQAANVIFLESPVGTGFSYSNNSDDVVTNGDKRTAEDNLTFLLKWFDRFPQYKGREFYITGESYAGHYIPQLAEALVKYQLSSSDKSINFQGFLVGNALTDDYNDQVGVSEYLWSNGLISDQTYKLKKLFCDHVSFLHSSSDCDKVTDVLNVELGKIDTYSVFTPACITNYSEGVPERLPIMRRLNEKYDPCSQNYSALYFNLPEVQKALHVNPSKWQSCNTVIFHTWKDSSSSVLDIYRELIKSGLRIWMFSGDTDAVIPVTSTRYDIDALKLPPASPWRPWYNDGQVGGWIEQYVGLTFVTVRGAGHKVPMTKPKLALALFKSFLSGTPLPTLSTGFSDF